MGLGWLLGSGEQHGIAVDVQYLPNLESRRRDGAAVDHQVPGVGFVPFGDPHEPAVRGEVRDAGYDGHPRGVAVLADDRRVARPGVHGQDPVNRLRTVLNDHEQALPTPVHGDDVLEAGPVPPDGHPGPVQSE